MLYENKNYEAGVAFSGVHVHTKFCQNLPNNPKVER